MCLPSHYMFIIIIGMCCVVTLENNHGSRINLLPAHPQTQIGFQQSSFLYYCPTIIVSSCLVHYNTREDSVISFQVMDLEKKV
jgi:hypothetical protein